MREMRKIAKGLLSAMLFTSQLAFCEKLELVWERSFDGEVVGTYFLEDISATTSSPAVRIVVGNLRHTYSKKHQLLDENGNILFSRQASPRDYVYSSPQGRYYCYQGTDGLILFDWNGRIVYKSSSSFDCGLHLSDFGSIAYTCVEGGAAGLVFPQKVNLVPYSKDPPRMAFSGNGEYLAVAAFSQTNPLGPSGSIEVALYTKKGQKMWSKLVNQDIAVINDISVSENAEQIAVVYLLEEDSKKEFPEYPIRHRNRSFTLRPRRLCIFDKTGQEFSNTTTEGTDVVLPLRGNYVVTYNALWGINLLTAGTAKRLWKYTLKTDLTAESVSLSQDGSRIAVALRMTSQEKAPWQVRLFSKDGTNLDVYNIPGLFESSSIHISNDSRYILVSASNRAHSSKVYLLRAQ